MDTLYAATAVTLVRKNLDELDPNGSIMYEDENGSSVDYGDNASLDNIILRNLPEAINAVHRAAPVQLLEGNPYTDGELASVVVNADGSLLIALSATAHFLRLVAFQAADSNIVVTDVIGEATPEGRKQLNPTIRGRYDRPKLVQCQGRHTGPIFKYYSLNEHGLNFDDYQAQPSSAIDQLVFIKEYKYYDGTVSYDISRVLRQNIIDYLTGLVLETYNDQRAQIFFSKANNF